MGVETDECECVATLTLAGRRHDGRPRGLMQAFPPSRFSLLVQGI